MSQLLILRDLECLPQAWHALNDMQSFERRQAGEPRALKHERLLGVWIEPSLLFPPSLKLENSFSLSGVWALCELELDGCQDNQPALQRELLIRAASEDPLYVASFLPVFDFLEPQDSIQEEIEKLQGMYRGDISNYLMFGQNRNNYKVKKTTPFSK